MPCRSACSPLPWRTWAFRATDGRPLPFLVGAVRHLREQSDFLHAVLGPGGASRGRGCARRSAEPGADSCMKNGRDNPTVFVEYYVAFYAAAYLGIIAHWIERGCPESSGDYGRIAMRLRSSNPANPSSVKVGEKVR